MLNDQELSVIKKAIVELGGAVSSEGARQALFCIADGFVQMALELQEERKFNAELLTLAERIINK